MAQVVRLAMDFRREFQRDVVIDMYCYRRRGHNEGDEPSFTQPLLYQAIEQRKSVREGYLEHLLELGGVTREEADEIAARAPRAPRAASSARARSEDYAPPHGPARRRLERLPRRPRGRRAGRRHRRRRASGSPSCSSALTRAARRTSTRTRKIERAARAARARWPTASGRSTGRAAEALALRHARRPRAHRVRLTGQDTRARHVQPPPRRAARRRGRRTATCRSQHLRAGPGAGRDLQQPASEAGVLGFEYGYSLDWPDGLVLWEAQFGDFVNVRAGDHRPVHRQRRGQVAAALSGLVLLLPHGFEGQGPEHSSARLERFLALAAEDNIQVVQPDHAGAVSSTCLRRQVLRRWRKPLVVMTPKSLLRHPEAVSPLDELADGTLPARASPIAPADADGGRAACCSARGKIYYELDERSARSWHATTSRSCGSSSSIRCADETLAARARAATATARRSSGCRRSRRTWAPGASCARASASAVSGACRSRGRRARRRPARPPARRAATSSSKPAADRARGLGAERAADRSNEARLRPCAVELQGARRRRIDHRGPDRRVAQGRRRRASSRTSRSS